MSYSIIATHRFEKELKRLAKKFPSLKNEFAKLVAKISDNPETGTPMLAKEKVKAELQGLSPICMWKPKRFIC